MGKYTFYLDKLYIYLPYTFVMITGFVFVLSGALISVYKGHPFSIPSARKRLSGDRLFKLVDNVSSLYPIKLIRENIRTSLSFCLLEDTVSNLVSGLLAIAITGVSIFLAIMMRSVGQLWYVKFLIISMSLGLPYYVTTLLLDLYKYYIGRHIPHMIDEFRSAFIKHNKVKPAFKECSLYIDRGLGRIISRAADSSFIEESLNTLKDKFNNIWFNIFVVLVSNFKENGGELIGQLYRLNRTMTRYTNIEKKKNKRLIWYEIFAVTASVFSIPAVFWLNSIILGDNGGMIIDAGANLIISQIIGFCILSLVIIRILRKM